MLTIRDHLTDLATILLVLSGILLRAIGKIAIAMGVLWMIGLLFPYVAGSLGLPYKSFYEMFQALINGIRQYPFCSF